MGELAEDVLDGSCCQLCMSYFEDKEGNIFTHGAPVVCKECYKELTKEEKKEYTLASANTM